MIVALSLYKINFIIFFRNNSKDSLLLFNENIAQKTWIPKYLSTNVIIVSSQFKRFGIAMPSISIGFPYADIKL